MTFTPSDKLPLCPVCGLDELYQLEENGPLGCYYCQWEGTIQETDPHLEEFMVRWLNKLIDAVGREEDKALLRQQVDDAIRKLKDAE